ncbi:MAG: hypothetical protein CMJ89_16130 [Planctomycetes bacterium]|nr:hypothetical protein [Planctomycetota bacterium]
MSVPRIVLLGAEGLSSELPENGMLVVGRSEDRAGFVVAGQGIEDAHFAIGRTKGGGWAVKDLGSEYGTLLNGQRISSARIRPGDKLVAGSRRFEIRTKEVVEARPPEPSPRPQDLPDRIGGYRIDRLLGRGGAGKVYLALQESLNRPVALKVLAPKYAADKAFIARFQSEARAAAALSHSNVVVVHDVGEAEGQNFLSMEFMPGGSLEQRLAAAGPLPWRQVLDFLADAASGLMYAEARGICHRDIKPANLMLTGAGSVKIADLGLATSTESESQEFGDGGKKIVGTPHFMSPEQARGERVDHRSDLYSLGATAYRLLSGHTPFEGETTRDILRALLTQEPLPLREFVEGLPRDLDAVIARLLSKSPADRFPSAEALRKEIDALRLAADRGEAFPSEALQKAHRSRRRGVMLGATGLVVAAAAVAYPFLGGANGQGNESALSTTAPTDVLPSPEFDGDDSFFTQPRTQVAEIDEEALLRLIEAEALLALNELPRDLAPGERIAALEEFLLEHPNAPKISGQARQELGTLKEGLLQTEARASHRSRALERAKLSWARAAEWPPPAGVLPLPARSLAGLRSLPLSLEFAGDARYLAARAAFESEVLDACKEALRRELEALIALEEEGAFEALRPRLELLAGRFDFHEVRVDDPPKLQSLRDLGTEVEARLAGLEASQARWRRDFERQRRRSVALALGPGSGFLQELEELGLTSIEARLNRAETSLSGEPAAVFLQLRRDHTHITLTIQALVDALDGEGWRRHAIQDPSGRGATRKIVGLSIHGMSFERSSGEQSWERLKAGPSWFVQLFNDRIARDYQEDEKRGILALLRWTGTARAVARGARFLSPDSTSTLADTDYRAIHDGLQTARAWFDKNAASLAEEEKLLGREELALELLAGSIRAGQQQSFALSVARLEQLLFDLDDTLTAVLLSDGRNTEPAPSILPTAKNAPDGEVQATSSSEDSSSDG